MSDTLLTYQQFYHEDQARDVAATLQQHQLHAELVDYKSLYNRVYLQEPVEPTIVLKIRAADFSRANKIMAVYYDKLLQDIDPGYYLFGFTNAELLEIVHKPHEWSILDQQLAKKLLNERGIELTAATAAAKEQQHIEKLARQEPVGPGWLLTGYAMAILGGFIGIFFGLALYCGKKTLPDGRRMYVYNKADRGHGLRIILLSLVAFIALFIKYFSIASP
jgi:hypothetical protein